ESLASPLPGFSSPEDDRDERHPNEEAVSPRRREPARVTPKIEDEPRARGRDDRRAEAAVARGVRLRVAEGIRLDGDADRRERRRRERERRERLRGGGAAAPEHVPPRVPVGVNRADVLARVRGQERAVVSAREDGKARLRRERERRKDVALIDEME